MGLSVAIRTAVSFMSADLSNSEDGVTGMLTGGVHVCEFLQSSLARNCYHHTLQRFGPRTFFSQYSLDPTKECQD